MIGIHILLIAAIAFILGVATVLTWEARRAYGRHAAMTWEHEPEPDEGTEREGCD